MSFRNGDVCGNRRRPQPTEAGMDKPTFPAEYRLYFNLTEKRLFLTAVVNSFMCSPNLEADNVFAS